MMLMLTNLIFSLLLCSGFASSRNFDGWELIKAEKDISVFKKDSKHHGLLAFGGSGEIDEPFLKVASVMMDVERLSEWMSDLEFSKIIRWTGPMSYIEHDHVGTPFIIKDREFVTEVKMKVSPDKKSISFENFDVEDPSVPENKYIRGKLSGSNFEVSSIDDGKRTKFHAEIHCDPRAALPDWVINLFQKGWPIDTFHNLKKQLKKTDLKTHPKIIEAFGKG